MIIVQICVGSSCYIRGSEKIIELFQKAVVDYKVEDEVALSGAFCSGKCNRVGVTVTLDDDVYTGITEDNFKSFFEEHVYQPIVKERGY